MPFKRTGVFKRAGKSKGQRLYRSPSGRKFTTKQVRLYYMTKGFRPSLMRKLRLGKGKRR